MTPRCKDNRPRTWRVYPVSRMVTITLVLVGGLV